MNYALVELSELMVSKTGSVDPKKYADEKFELFSIPAFDRGCSDLVVGSEIGSSKQLVKSGDVMLSKIVPHIRRAWVVPPSGDHRQIASGEWILFRSPRIYGPFLRHVLTSDAFNKQFMRTVAGVGGSLLRARPAHVAKIRVPLPTLEEQRRLATILDKADGLRATRQQALAQLESLRAAHVHGLLSQQQWPEHAFGELCSRLTVGVVVRPASHYVTDGIPALRSLNVRAGSLDLTNLVHFSESSHKGPLRKSQLRPGDVVIVRTGNAGTSAVVPADAGELNAIDLIIATPNPTAMLPEYAVAFLNSEDGKRMVMGERRGQIQQHFNVRSLQMASIPVPPIHVQQELVSRLALIDRVRSAQLTQLAKLDALSGSLQHRMLRGEL